MDSRSEAILRLPSGLAFGLRTAAGSTRPQPPPRKMPEYFPRVNYDPQRKATFFLLGEGGVEYQICISSESLSCSNGNQLVILCSIIALPNFPFKETHCCLTTLCRSRNFLERREVRGLEGAFSRAEEGRISLVWVWAGD